MIMIAVNFKISIEEKKELEQRAKKLNMTLSGLIRESSLNYSSWLIKQKEEVFGQTIK